MTTHHKALIYLFIKLSFTLCTYLSEYAYLPHLHITHTFICNPSNIHVQLNLKHLFSALSCLSIHRSSLPLSLAHSHRCILSLYHSSVSGVVIISPSPPLLFISLSLPPLSVPPFFFPSVCHSLRHWLYPLFLHYSLLPLCLSVQSLPVLHLSPR